MTITDTQSFLSELRTVKWPNDDIPEFVDFVFHKPVTSMQFSHRRNDTSYPQIEFDHLDVKVTMSFVITDTHTNFVFSTVDTNGEPKYINDWPSVYTLYRADTSTISEWKDKNGASRFTGPAVIVEANGKVKKDWHFLGKKITKIEDEEQFYTWCDSVGIDVKNIELVDIGWIMMKWA